MMNFITNKFMDTDDYYPLDKEDNLTSKLIIGKDRLPTKRAESDDGIIGDEKDKIKISLDEYIRLHNIDKELKMNPLAKRYGRKITEADMELEDDLKAKKSETLTFQKGSFVYKFQQPSSENGNSGFSLNIERSDSNKTNQTKPKDLESTLAATLSEMSRMMKKQIKDNSNSLFRITKPVVSKESAPVNADAAIKQELVRRMKQDTIAKYNMQVQKNIAIIQKKPLIYKCNGNQKPTVINVDGPGIDDIQVTPTQTNVSLNSRFC